MQDRTPIQAFFTQAADSNTKWWTWLAVFWFAIMLWFYGQVVFGTFLVGAIWLADPSVKDSMTQIQSEGSANQTILSTVRGIFFSSLIAFLLYMLRNQFSSKLRKAMLTIAAAFAIISFVALIFMSFAGSNPEGIEMMNDWMSKSAGVYMFVLLMFPPFAIGLWLGVKHMQKRTILSLHTAHFKFRWGRMFFAMLVLWAIASIITYGSHVTGASPVKRVFDPARFWMYLPITLLFIPLQSATEEIALRGYLNQGLGKYIKNPWVVFVLTSAAFASLHLGNPEVAETVKKHSVLLALSGYFFFGLFACVLTYIDGGLESAIGMHAANNIFAAAIVGYDNSALPVPTVFKVGLNTGLDSLLLIVSLSVVCLIMYVTRRPLIPATQTLDTFN
ncbi:CPBP family intramembrane metalloprotease [bacterium AH-315-J19]|nr:CPBP family intramembrane metalloprotease [Robiginitomaculum sp.]MBN4058581.1 CPBP family intramembrane metalloprotease [bacterium AH-315-J19]